MKRVFSLFKNKEFLILLALIVSSILIKLIDLDIRPIHHDESLHASYGLYWFKDPLTSFYKYDPMLHGPLLYYLLPFIYFFGGVNLFAARFLIVIVSSLALSALSYFMIFLKKSEVKLLFLIFIFSAPSVFYWSRFLRHDFLLILPSIIFVIYFYKQKSITRSIVIGVSFAIPFVVKENSFIHLFHFIFINLLCWLLSPQVSKRRPTFLISKYFYLSLISAIFTYTYFMSSGFNHFPAILDGLYRKSILYWFNQHHIERIKGPFSYQALILFFYEPLFVITILGISIHQLLKSHFRLLKYTVLFLIIFVLIGHYSFESVKHSYWSQLLKIKIPLDWTISNILLILGVFSFFEHFYSKRFLISKLSYLFFAFMFTYSFVGEKVPWLALYPYILGIIYISYYLDYYNFNKKLIYCFAGFTLIFNSYRIWIINFNHVDKKNHLISQVQTTNEYHQLAKKIRYEMDNRPKGLVPFVFMKQENAWPLTWYLYGREEYHYHSPQLKLEQYDLIYTGKSDKSMDLKLSKTHTQRIISLRHWYLPKYNNISMINAFNYMLFFRPWNSPGTQYIKIFVRK